MIKITVQYWKCEFPVKVDGSKKNKMSQKKIFYAKKRNIVLYFLINFYENLCKNYLLSIVSKTVNIPISSMIVGNLMALSIP